MGEKLGKGEGMGAVLVAGHTQLGSPMPALSGSKYLGILQSSFVFVSLINTTARDQDEQTKEASTHVLQSTKVWGSSPPPEKITSTMSTGGGVWQS